MDASALTRRVKPAVAIQVSPASSLLNTPNRVPT